jgi:hypothetical protein
MNPIFGMETPGLSEEVILTAQQVKEALEEEMVDEDYPPVPPGYYRHYAGDFWGAPAWEILPINNDF